MTKLCELAEKYGCDKCPQVGHPYTPHYYELLKYKDIKKVLELGIGSRETMQWTPDNYQKGASLKMWRDFFPEAQIYGVDNKAVCMFSDERIKTFNLNTLKPNQMEWLISEIGQPDLVIDDGNHRTSAQITTAKNLMLLLKKDVIYIIEDAKSPSIVKDKLSEYDVEILTYTPHTQNTLILVKHK